MVRNEGPVSWRGNGNGVLRRFVSADFTVTLPVASTASPIPGFHLPPLSQLNVSPPINNADLVSFSPAEHLTQHGQSVTQIPFSRHPLNLLKKLSSMPRRIARDEDDVSFDPKQFKETLYAAYPLYVPLYLGEWAMAEGGQEKRVTTAAFAGSYGPVSPRSTCGLLSTS